MARFREGGLDPTLVGGVSCVCTFESHPRSLGRMCLGVKSGPKRGGAECHGLGALAQVMLEAIKLLR